MLRKGFLLGDNCHQSILRHSENDQTPVANFCSMLGNAGRRGRPFNKPTAVLSSSHVLRYSVILSPTYTVLFHSSRMPALEDITYSRERCIAAFRSYFDFLAKMYLDESYIIEPPVEGWPSTSAENMKSLGKPDEVISLLRHLPYIRNPGDDSLEAQAVPYGVFADWQRIGASLGSGRSTGYDIKMGTEGAEYQEIIPGHVFGLIHGGRDDETLLLDTQLGVVYWLDCPNRPRHVLTREQVFDDS